jgi:hypothetical protein
MEPSSLTFLDRREGLHAVPDRTPIGALARSRNASRWLAHEHPLFLASPAPTR